MPISNVRVVGSNYTTFRWRGKSIAYLEAMRDEGVTPVAPPQAIHPLGFEHPTEWAVARAMNGGALSFTIRELWDKPVWQHLHGLANAQNLLDVWKAIGADPTAITCQSIISPPTGNYYRVKTYHNCIVSAIDDTDNIEIGAMTVPRNIRVQYTHSTQATVSNV